MSVADFLAKADSALQSARRDPAAGDHDGAANRLYYAMFHAARAALFSVGAAADGKHGTIIAQFGLRFCKDGPLPPRLGRALNEAEELRAEGDYGTTSPDATAVGNYVAIAEEFVEAVRQLVSGTRRSGSRPRRNSASRKR